MSKNNQETHMVSLFEGKYNGPFFPSSDEVDKAEFIPLKDLPSLENKMTPHTRVSLKEIGLLK